MTERKKNLAVAAKILVVALAISMTMNSVEAIAQTGPPQNTPQGGPAVTVVNTTANPVPVTGNLTGNVTVTNNPNITVTNQVTVRDADNAGRHAVTIVFGTNSTSGAGFQFWQKSSIYTVPAG